MERLFWTIQVDPKCPYTREPEGDLTTKTEVNVRIEVPKCWADSGKGGRGQKPHNARDEALDTEKGKAMDSP